MQGTGPQPFLMSAGDIIDAAVRLYRNNAALFLSVLAILLVPLAILDAISPAFNVLSVFATPFSIGALILAISARHADSPITPTQAYSALGVGTGLSLLLAEILYGLTVFVGLLILIIPGIYLGVRYVLVPVTVVVERQGIGAAFTRSGQLVSGNWWRVFGIGVLVVILVLLAAGILGVLLAVSLGPRIADVVGIIIDLLLYPFVYSALVLLYYDLRARKDGMVGVGSTPGYGGSPFTS